MSECKRETIDSSAVGLSFARENCPGELPSGVEGSHNFSASVTDAEVSRFESSYNACEKELRVDLDVTAIAEPSLKLRVNRDRGGSNNIGLQEFAGGNRNWQIIEDATAVARWDRLIPFTSGVQTLITLINLEGEVEDGDVFTIEVSSDDFATSLTQTLTVVIDGTGIVTWKEIAFTEDGDTGSEKTVQERNTRTPSRQRQRGGLIDSESQVGYEVEVTNSTFDDMIEAFCYAKTRNQKSTLDGDFEATAVGDNTITVDDPTLLPTGSLILVSGLMGTANGMKLVTATTANGLTVDIEEQADVSELQIHKVGVQGVLGDIEINVVGPVVSLDSTALDFTSLDLHIGQAIWVGGDASNTRFEQGFGSARIHRIEENKLTLQQVRWARIQTEDAADKTIQLFFGDYTRNEKDPTLIKRFSHQFEQILGSDQIGLQSRYFTGQAANEMSVDLTSAEGMTASFGFIGLGTEIRDGSEGLKPGVRLSASKEDPINSADHIRDMFVYVNDDTRLTPKEVIGAVETMELTINNNATFAKRIGRLGAYAINIGNFAVDMTASAAFTTVESLRAIERASDVGASVFSVFNNQGMLFDIPSITMGGDIDTGDEYVKIELENAAAESKYGYTLSFTRFNYLPDIANPVPE